MSKYIAVIGMEVHCELKTASRMFSGEVNGMGSEDVPNSHNRLLGLLTGFGK